MSLYYNKMELAPNADVIEQPVAPPPVDDCQKLKNIKKNMLLNGSANVPSK